MRGVIIRDDGTRSAERRWVSRREVKIGIRVGFTNRELRTSVGMSSQVGEEYGGG